MSDMNHRLIMLKPMQVGVSGYARMQSDRGQTLIQINLRGVKIASVRAFWYCSDYEVRELGVAKTNKRGEAAIEAELPQGQLAPERLHAILIIGEADEPIPLMIGLCDKQNAGNILDAKNASMALCEKLSKNAKKRRAQDEAERAAKEERAMQEQRQREAALMPKTEPVPVRPEIPVPERVDVVQSVPHIPPVPYDDPPREIFLPAIDPFPYIIAQEAEEPRETSNLVEPSSETVMEAPPESIHRTNLEIELPPRPIRNDPPADRARRLVWPKPFEPLRSYFQTNKPCAIFRMPGWRFVKLSTDEGMYIGYWQMDGKVRRIAYAIPQDTPPPDGRPYRARRGMDGRIYQVLWQKV